MPRKRPHPSRCLWVDGRGQCRFIGQGDPPLCPDHAEQVEHQRRQDLIDQFLDHPAVTRLGRTVEERVQHVLDHVTGVIERSTSRLFESRPEDHPFYQGPHMGYASECPPRPKQQQQQQRQRQQAPPPPPREDPRTVLGFAPGSRPSRNDIVKRRRELARIFHSDLGGHDGAMQRVNKAVEDLMTELKHR